MFENKQYVQLHAEREWLPFSTGMRSTSYPDCKSSAAKVAVSIKPRHSKRMASLINPARSAAFQAAEAIPARNSSFQIQPRTKQATGVAVGARATVKAVAFAAHPT